MPLLGTTCALTISACDATAEYPLLIMFPTRDCSAAKSYCVPYLSCLEYGVRLFRITVGPSHPKRTVIGCPTEYLAPSALVPINYTPGQTYYEVTSEFERNGSTQVIGSGPLYESDAQVPWELQLD